ncbi:hypothetical protein [Polaribacter ponticola]|uniref:Tetratricopeptide repeat protein n=1 Tax=Polaribacter ponticola TaxID=2978475 RepID=A0ABT5SAA6_9FLAO|nr:hypothetical protein [Polaribacter sp. MSW5]MDD7915023.1 hypothetical protein [Polaribacter sp. MSW5]
MVEHKNTNQKEQDIQQLQTAELRSVIDEFPYFQSVRALYLKSLKNQNSFKYNNELKITAAYTTDRSVLFDFITSKKFNTKNEDSKIKTEETIPNKNISEVKIAPLEIVEKAIIEPIVEAEEKLEIGKPITFSSSESHSFNQWLQLSTKKPIVRKETPKKRILKKVELIEKFIQNNPKISPLTKDKNVSISIAQNKQDSSLMTETLAKVYLEQKKYENAIQAYRILSLKYPEKSGFFADQIKRIQILQKNRS